MKTILFLTEVLAGTHVDKLEGVYELARRYGWHVVVAEFENTQHSIADYISTWHPDGCIVVGSALTAPLSPRSFSELPTVYLDPDEKTRRAGKAYVASDPRPLAELAARELMALDCAAYAFVGWNARTAWSEDRRRAFAAIIRGAKLPFAAFAGHFSPKDRIVVGWAFDGMTNKLMDTDYYWYHNIHCAEVIVRYREKRDQYIVTLQFTPW